MRNSIADKICEEISIKQILSMYGWDIGRHGRTKCPLHNGKDDNFSYSNVLFQCFVCGEKGNVIQLTQKLYNIDFRQALYKINDYFGLDLIKNKRGLHERAKAKEERRIGKLVEKDKEEYLKKINRECKVLIQMFQDYNSIDNPSDFIKRKLSWLEMWIEEYQERLEQIDG